MLPWQQHSRCHSDSFMMYIAGAKFEEHCFNISRVILDWVLCCFSGTTYDVITYNTKTEISSKRKMICQKGKRHSSLDWKAFQISSKYFLLHRHFNKTKFYILLTCQESTLCTWLTVESWQPIASYFLSLLETTGGWVYLQTNSNEITITVSGTTCKPFPSICTGFL